LATPPRCARERRNDEGMAARYASAGRGRLCCAGAASRAEELGRASQRSALARRTGFRLEATAAVPDGKALGGFDRGSLSLWWTRDKATLLPRTRAAQARSHETIGVDVSPHLFRTAAATTSACYGTDMPYLASVVLGNTDPRVTEEHYIRTTTLNAAKDYAAILSLGAILGEGERGMPKRRNRKRQCSEPRCCWHQGSKGRTSEG
jgi:hypothetical protein